MNYSDFHVIRELGEGGNAKVNLVEDPLHTKVAIKVLTNKSKEKKSRFLNEIHILKDWGKKVAGIMPIYDYSETEFWYTMPIATPVMERIINNRLSPNIIVDYFIELCYTIAELHKNGISHRDIKPDNIHFYNNRLYLGDFGLVDFPDNVNNLTRSDKGLGAVFTIAPEMKRDPKNSDGIKADVYSLAKTLWMLLSLNGKGFDGQYNYFDSTHALNRIESLEATHLIEIEELISDSTNNDPNDRPSIEEFIIRLQKWKDVVASFSKQQKSQWLFLNEHILHNSGESVTWRDLDRIIDTLNSLSAIKAYNHMFFPDGGGQDFVSAIRTPEENGIEIWDDNKSCNIVFPKALHFEVFPHHEEWNYFLLELKTVEMCFDSEFCHEELVEDTTAHYIKPTYYQYGVYDYDTGDKYPIGYRLVERYTRGKFLFVLKNGPYNLINSTYDARHNDCSCEQFRDYINTLIDEYKLYGEDKSVFYNSQIANINPFIEKEDIASAHSITLKDIIKKHSISEDDYYSFRFKIVEFKEGFEGKYAKFYISFEPNNGMFEFDFKEIRLCTDGFLRKFERDNFCNVLFFSDREHAHEVLYQCKEKLLGEYGKEVFGYFLVKVIGISKPEHLFTRDEIESLMKEADDRVNNVLVIDEKGYARIVENNALDVHSFPVHHEKWIAGNKYVGKYSNLSTLEESYLSSLQGWLSYLQTKRSIYVDYLCTTKAEEALIDEINKTQ